MGSLGAEQIRRALMLEVIVEQRFRILEVIETVTLDLQDELSICLGDANPKIRRAAFRLAERLHHEGLVEVLEPLARDDDPAVAKGAVRSLTSLGSDEAAGILVSVLDGSKDPEIAVACCQGLGQIGGPAAVNALSRVLSRKKLLVLGLVWSDQVRATAAMVLSNLADPASRDVLQRFVNDRDPRIRRIARAAPSAD
jgi:HEAT repeat protein